MIKKIHPKLLSYSIDEKWQENMHDGDIFGRDPGIRWVVSFEISLFDEQSRAILAKSAWLRFKSRHQEWLNSNFNRDGALGELFGFIVCSPAFRKNPTNGYVQIVDRAFVQDNFNEATAVEYLRSKVDAIGEKDVSTIGDDLRKFLDTEEWDFTFED